MPSTLELAPPIHPDTLEQLQNLPPHLVEHIGETALVLTHLDMHPSTEVKPTVGESYKVPDFEQNLTETTYAADDFEGRALEAAREGKEKLSRLLQHSSLLVKMAHGQLTEEGFQFGSLGDETEEAAAVRETEERNKVYQIACEMAAQEAIDSSDENPAHTVESLESLILLRMMGKSEDNRLLRSVVHQGLGKELLQATQNSAKVLNKQTSGNVSLSMFGAKGLLELANNTSLDYSFKPSYDLDLEHRQWEPNDYKNIMAIISGKDPSISVEDGLAYLSNYEFTQRIKDRMDPATPAEAPNSLESFYQVVEQAAEPNDLNEAFKCEDPRLVFEASQKLGLKPWEVAWIFGRADNIDSIKRIDPKEVEQFAEIKTRYPEYYEAIVRQHWQVSSRHVMNGGPGYDVGAVLEALGELSASGVKDSELVAGICDSADASAYAAVCAEVVTELEAMGVDQTELGTLLQKAGRSGMRYFIDEINADNFSAEEGVEKLVTEVEIIDAYMAEYAEITYPVLSFKDEEFHPTPELSQLPQLQGRMQKLGLAPELCESIYQSWATYSDFIRHHYSDKEGFMPPKEPVPEARLQMIARNQAEALITQVDALEDFVENHGLEATQEVIDTFGIYHFARHDSATLFAQSEQWKTGGAVKTVVVEARSDWNKFTSAKPVFEEEQGEGVFYFEANSATEVSRIAIKVGAHERTSGREPDVKRFVVHAHGNPDVMALGVNGERLTTASYVEAARKRAKLKNAELNDYKKHLGQDFEVILQSCSTAGDNGGLNTKNIAKTMHGAHDVRVLGSPVTIHGVTIHKDGSIEFDTKEGDGKPVIYDV